MRAPLQSEAAEMEKKSEKMPAIEQKHRNFDNVDGKYADFTICTAST